MEKSHTFAKNSEKLCIFAHRLSLTMRKLLLFTWLCIAQMAAGQRTGETVFKTLGLADGLRSNAVTSLLADSRGYLWIGTYQGINRYDGHQVKTRFPESGDPQLREVFAETTTHPWRKMPKDGYG